MCVSCFMCRVGQSHIFDVNTWCKGDLHVSRVGQIHTQVRTYLKCINGILAGRCLYIRSYTMCVSVHRSYTMRVSVHMVIYYVCVTVHTVIYNVCVCAYGHMQCVCTYGHIQCAYTVLDNPTYLVYNESRSTVLTLGMNALKKRDRPQKRDLSERSLPLILQVSPFENVSYYEHKAGEYLDFLYCIQSTFYTVYKALLILYTKRLSAKGRSWDAFNRQHTICTCMTQPSSKADVRQAILNY